MKIVRKLFCEVNDWLSFFIIWLPGGLGRRFRYLLYSKFFARCSQKVCIDQGCRIKAFKNISLGNNVHFGTNAQIYAFGTGKETIEIGNNIFLNSNVMLNANNGGKIIIGNNVMIGPNVVFRACNHDFLDRNIPIISQGHTKGFINVKDDVWIGANAVILANVTIGKGAVVAAGAVVTKDIEDYAVVAGVPARKVKSR